MVAFAMTAMVACDEKENEPESTASDLADNTLVYDGTTYHMVAGQSFYHTGLTTVDAVSQETDGSGNFMVCSVNEDIQGSFSILKDLSSLAGFCCFSKVALFRLRICCTYFI